jgi:hypothetical protein
MSDGWLYSNAAEYAIVSSDGAEGRRTVVHEAAAADSPGNLDVETA